MRETAYTIEAMRLEDIPEVLHLEREAFGQMAWHAGDFEAAIASKCDFPLVIRTTGLAGYAVLRIIAPEAEVENICVAPACRRSGVGEALMEEMLRLAAERDAERIFLEVRAHNEPAKALYRKRGFVESYRRRNYYQGPTEDAIIMMKE
ncbi:MAG: ribosomal protein S18-alanine N-acetyltransferase [Oribacterium sp.]|nr:ribosomal protein S18-alanine N-acetyltransferase [Oribacterium sp.]